MKKLYFEKLKSSLISSVENCYILEGKDIFLLDKSVDIIANALNIAFPELNYIKFDYDQFDVSALVRALNTPPAFSDFKMVLLDASLITKNINLEELENYLLNPNPACKFVVKLGTNTVFKINCQHATLVDCNKLTADTIKKYILSIVSKNGKKITQSAINLLIEITSGNMMKIDNELKKLVFSVGVDEEINEEHVASNVDKVLDFKIFELTENLAKKNATAVYEILNHLKQAKDGYRGLLPLIYNHFRRLLLVAITPLKNNELATFLSVKEYAVMQYSKQIKLFSKKRLKEIVDYCSQLDFFIKQGKTNANLAIDMLVLNIING